jgi:hypothetical protein
MEKFKNIFNGNNTGNPEAAEETGIIDDVMSCVLYHLITELII